MNEVVISKYVAIIVYKHNNNVNNREPKVKKQLFSDSWLKNSVEYKSK